MNPSLSMTALEQGQAYLAGDTRLETRDTIARLVLELEWAEAHKVSPNDAPFAHIAADGKDKLFGPAGMATVYRNPPRDPRRRGSALWAAPVDPGRDVDKLLVFAGRILGEFPELGDVDGGSIQDWAAEHGLLEPRKMVVPCGEACACREYGTEPGDITTCYRPTALLRRALETFRQYQQRREARRKK